MPVSFRYLYLLLTALLLLAAAPAPAQPDQPGQQHVYLPVLYGLPAPPGPFGFDLRAYTSNETLQYVRDARPRWTRAGDVFWSDIEPVRGGGYRWDVLAAVEANIRRIRAASGGTIEPVLVVHRSPSWAQRIPGRLCSPMKPEFVGDFARFMAALAARYASGPLAVHYWEIWNEPDVPPAVIHDEAGLGCWVDPALPYFGGAYYGQVLQQIYAPIKAANPRAIILAGALLYAWPDDTISRLFLEGMLASGAGNAFDMLSFHAYGEWDYSDLLVSKTVRIRQVLEAYGLGDKPLFASEVAAMCGSDDKASCKPDFAMWSERNQGYYAARIYAEAIALNLKGALWYTLAHQGPGFRYSQLIDEQDGQLVPRPSYYAFLNSALLLQGARYIGPPVQPPAPWQKDQVQTLIFQTPRETTLHVLWVPEIDFPVPYTLEVAPGARAICTNHLDGGPTEPDPQKRLQRYDCSDRNKDGKIALAINELPQYVEILD